MSDIKTKEGWDALGTPAKPIWKPKITETVNHPPHYTQGGIEVIDFIEAKKLSYKLGNVVKYIARAEYKSNKLEDLRKASWYLNREIKQLEAQEDD